MKQKSTTIKSRSKLWFALAVLVLAAILCGIMTQGFKDFNPYCWFGHKFNKSDVCTRCGAEKPVKEPEAVVSDDQGNIMASNKVHAMPKGIVFSAPHKAASGIATQAAAREITVKATVTPDAAKYADYTWTVAFTNVSDSWAKGKTASEYVTVTPSPSDKLTAKITCKQNFGAQIMVTITCELNGNSKSCTVDVKKNVENWELKFTSSASPATNFSITKNSSNARLPIWTKANPPSYNIEKKITYSVGTIEPQIYFYWSNPNCDSEDGIVIENTVVFDAQFVNEIYSSLTQFYADYGSWDETEVRAETNDGIVGTATVSYDVSHTSLAAETIELNQTTIVFQVSYEQSSINILHYFRTGIACGHGVRHLRIA